MIQLNSASTLRSSCLRPLSTERTRLCAPGSFNRPHSMCLQYKLICLPIICFFHYDISNLPREDCLPETNPSSGAYLIRYQMSIRRLTSLFLSYSERHVFQWSLHCFFTGEIRMVPSSQSSRWGVLGKGQTHTQPANFKVHVLCPLLLCLFPLSYHQPPFPLQTAFKMVCSDDSYALLRQNNILGPIGKTADE